MATYDCEVVQAVSVLGESVGGLPDPIENSLPDTSPAEGIGSARGGGGGEKIRDVPLLTREVP